MNDCILLALYLPDLKKKYVIQEIFDYIKTKNKYAHVFIGIQSYSHEDTEEIIRKIKGKLTIKTKRVKDNMAINSDASSFLAALELYKSSSMDYDKVFFVHSKGITSNNDQLRKVLYDEIFDMDTIDKHFSNDILVGSYGPIISITDVQEDIDKMSSFRHFAPNVLTHKVMEYYYLNTFYIIKNHIVKSFIENCSEDFFTTPIEEYSDRYFIERDFEHIVDMQGYLPSYKILNGNYSTNYQIPTQEKLFEKYDKYIKDNKNAN